MILDKDTLDSLPPSGLPPIQQVQGIPPQFKDLEDAIGKIRTYAILPMQVRVDYLRVTESSIMTNITVQFQNRDLQFQSGDGGARRRCTSWDASAPLPAAR